MDLRIEGINVEDIYKKGPFLYLVGDSYYYLGDGLCLECLSQGEIDRLKRFNKSVENYRDDLLNLRILDKETLDSIDFWFSKIVLAGKNKRNDSKYPEQRDKLVD